MYLIQKPTSSQLVVSSNATFTWLFAGVMTALGLYLMVYSWFFLPDRTFEVSVMMTVFGFFILALALWLFRLFTVNTSFNKGDGFFSQERIWLWKNEFVQHPIHTIKDIHVVQKGTVGKDRKYFKIILELDSGELLPLSSGNHSPEAIVRQQALMIRAFIEL